MPLSSFTNQQHLINVEPPVTGSCLLLRVSRELSEPMREERSGFDNKTFPAFDGALRTFCISSSGLKGLPR
jgi:hypothetical protein